MIVKFILYLVLTILGLTLFKSGSQGIQFNIGIQSLGFTVSTKSLLGIVFYSVSFLLYLDIIKNNELSYISPIATGSVTLLTIIVGKYIFGEQVGIAHIIGVILIIAGVTIINISK